MPIVVAIGSKDVNLDDLPLSSWERIEEIAGESWVRINPYTSARQARAVVTAAAEHVGADVAEVLGKLTPRTLLEMVRIVEDDKPEMYRDGVPQ